MVPYRSLTFHWWKKTIVAVFHIDVTYCSYCLWNLNNTHLWGFMVVGGFSLWYSFDNVMFYDSCYGSVDHLYEEMSCLERDD